MLNKKMEENRADETRYELFNRCLVIHIEHDLDHHSTIELREKSDKLIEKKNVKNIIFDFNGVSFMDSSGIGMIMGRYKKVIFTGGKIAVVGVGGSVDRIFEMSGLYKIIHKFNNIETAIKEL